MIWTLLFLSLNLSAQESVDPLSCFQENELKINAARIWEDQQWMSLLHMREGLFTPKSEADGPDFFIASPGSSPKEELLATVKAFCSNVTRQTESSGVPQIQARCQFPAREHFLEKKGLGGWPKPECPQLNDWKNRVGREKVHLVFSSYYANNPSSVFGHTLLRFDRVQSSSGTLFSPLLSYGVNFAGETTTSNPVLYAVLGMAGGFKGKFASLPYYYKVREYSDFDSRDLWEYELNLTPEQIELLLNHLWEQGFSYYNYYYFTENCSYHLLTTLDVAVPEHKLDEKIPPWVIPVDTVKAVSQKSPGLVTDITFRPSLYRQFMARLKRLEERDLDEHFFVYIETKELPNHLSELEQAYVMDAVLDYWDFKHSKELLDPSSSPSQEKAGFLRLRAKLPTTEPLVFDLTELERPDESHESLRVGVAGGYNSTFGEEYRFDLRFALHDFLDPQQGYPSTAKIEFFRVTGSYFSERDQFKFTEMKFFDVQLISPFKKLESSYSWRALIGLNRSFVGCDYCLAGRVLMQGGGALGFFEDRMILFGLLGLDARVSSELQRADLLALPAGTLGVRILLPSQFNFLVENDYLVNSVYALPNSHRFSTELRKGFGLQWAIGGDYSRETFEGFENETYHFNAYHYF